MGFSGFVGVANILGSIKGKWAGDNWAWERGEIACRTLAARRDNGVGEGIVVEWGWMDGVGVDEDGEFSINMRMQRCKCEVG